MEQRGARLTNLCRVSEGEVPHAASLLATRRRGGGGGGGGGGGDGGEGEGEEGAVMKEGKGFEV